jgi:hypothetical protein
MSFSGSSVIAGLERADAVLELVARRRRACMSAWIGATSIGVVGLPCRRAPVAIWQRFDTCSS